ncbi:alpha/beta hydrolase [Streptomyces sp. DvalAA-19]|uniref:alpha/beta fold hydrolase n=1 Tax=Streptomyces sp. DvalAA-19 TaxID=1839761 RepID=UPI00081BAE7E|nr:alpha/beta hydrolase [Streptomyces sp. DvalAA-19]SCE26172.1 Pimeloyl-ACP methyl ester carboxylesterase [Streptomyces sp. DvalAA-19]
MNEDIEVHGSSGPPVLLLPGGHVSCHGFYPGYPEALVADPGARVIVHDRPGTGKSTVPGTLAGASEHLHALVRRLGMGPVVVVGQSLGGDVALLFARDFPEDVAGLVLLDPVPCGDADIARLLERRYAGLAGAARVPPLRRLIRRAMRAKAEREIAERGLRGSVAEALEWSADIDVRELARALEGLCALAEGFRESDLPRGVPAAVVSADHEPGRIGDGARAAHARVAAALGVPVTRWPGTSHSLHLEQPERTIDVIRAVVRRTTNLA